MRYRGKPALLRFVTGVPDFAPLVDIDLLVELPEMLLKACDLLLNASPMSHKNGEPFFHPPLLVAHEVHELVYLDDRHAGVAQAAQERQPLQIQVAERPAPRTRTSDPG